MKRAKTNASAKVVEGNLIISLPNAKNPVVWRMALGEARAAAIEVVPRDADHVLVLKTAKGETTDIAPFDTREAATEALMAVSHAMENSGGHIKPSATSADRSTTATKDGPAWKWLIPLALILAALFFFSRTASMTTITTQDTSTVGTSTTGGSGDVGVPLSADSFLSGF